MRIRWLPAAIANLDEHAEYIAQDNPGAAVRVVTLVGEAVALLTRYPAIGRPGRVPGTRELVIHGTPYIVPYRIRGDLVEILRVFHAARKWPDQF